MSESPISLLGLSPESFEFSGLLSYFVESESLFPIVRPDAAISMQLVSITGTTLAALNLPWLLSCSLSSIRLYDGMILLR